VLKIPDEFINRSDRNRLSALGRGVVGLIGRKLGDHTIGAVAGHFKRDSAAMTQGVKKVEAKLREESDFKQVIEKIEKPLIKKREKKCLLVISNVAKTLANALVVLTVKPVLDLIGERESIFFGQVWIPVFTGMTGGHKRLSPENRDSRVKILAPQGVDKFCR